MSVYADGCGRIRLVRGDSGALTVSCETLEGERRPFEAGERVVFTVKERYTDPAPKLVKEVTQFTEEGEAVLRFQSADTRGLACTAYCYDVRLHGADGSVDTIVPKNEFLVGEAVGDG